jgi:hypothetical protein
MLVWFGIALGATIDLPDGEEPSLWREPLAVAGLVAVDAGADVQVEVLPSAWRLRARDATGALRVAELPVPRDLTSREAVSWLAASLLRPAPGVAVAAPTPTAAPLPPVRSASTRPAAARAPAAPPEAPAPPPAPPERAPAPPEPPAPAEPPVPTEPPAPPELPAPPEPPPLPEPPAAPPSPRDPLTVALSFGGGVHVQAGYTAGPLATLGVEVHTGRAWLGVDGALVGHDPAGLVGVTMRRVPVTMRVGWQGPRDLALRAGAGAGVVVVDARSAEGTTEGDVTPVLVAEVGVRGPLTASLGWDLGVTGGLELRDTRFDVAADLGTAWVEPALRLLVRIPPSR